MGCRLQQVAQRRRQEGSRYHSCPLPRTVRPIHRQPRREMPSSQLVRPPLGHQLSVLSRICCHEKNKYEENQKQLSISSRMTWSYQLSPFFPFTITEHHHNLYTKKTLNCYISFFLPNKDANLDKVTKSILVTLFTYLD